MAKPSPVPDRIPDDQWEATKTSDDRAEVVAAELTRRALQVYAKSDEPPKR